MAGAVFPAAITKDGQAMCMGSLDVCKVPAPSVAPIPTSFPNITRLNLAMGTTTPMLFGNMPTLVEMSETPISSGNEAAVLWGVVSNTFVGLSCQFDVAQEWVRRGRA